MTNLEQLHHGEQMEATRREFSLLWPGIWKRISQSDRKATHALCHHTAWITWCAAKKITEPKR